MGVATGCGFKEIYRLLIPTPLVSVLFAAASLLFCSFFSFFIASEASFLVCSMARIFYIYLCIFQAVRRAVNVLNVSTCI